MTGKRCGAAALLASAGALAQSPAVPSTRGALLYDTHCVACHNSQVHWRDKKLVADWDTLKDQVRQWQASARLDWSEADIVEVARHLNEAAPFIERSQSKVLRWGLALMGVSLLVGVLAAGWLSRQLGRLRRYAQAVTAGERVALPEVPGEFGELGRALETMRAQLEGKQYVDQYVHTLTHELKAPLAAIRGSAELLESPMPDQDRARFVDNIRHQGERRAQMIDKLLALSAPASRLNKRAVRLGAAAWAGLLAVEKLYLTELMSTQDAHEGVASFLEKRAPVWKHR